MRLPRLPDMRLVRWLPPLLLAGAALAQGGPPPTPVTVAPVVERDMPATMRVVGSILPDREATVAAEVEGPIARFDVEEGDFLKAGDTICEIDPTVARLRLAEARADLAARQATLAELENGTRPEIIARLEAAYQEAQALHEKWRLEKERIDRLYASDASSQKEKNDADTEFLAAKRREAQAKAALEEARNGPRSEQIARARQDVAAQQALVDRLQHDLDETTIKAPFDGFVVRKQTELGEWIDAGGAVADMVAVETVKVRVDVPESAVRFCPRGATVTLDVQALGETVPATVTRVIPQAQPNARTFPVEIELDNGEHRLLPGMFVRAVVPSGPKTKRLMVDRDAIIPQQGGRLIYVVRTDDAGNAMAVPLPAEAGLEVGSEVQVEAPGLQAGDRVVVRGNERLRGESPVIPRPQQAEEPGPTAEEAGPPAAATVEP